MKITRTISTVEVHTGGEAFRIVTSELPRLPGDTIVKRRTWLKDSANDVRKLLVFDPRGPRRHVWWPSADQSGFRQAVTAVSILQQPAVA